MATLQSWETESEPKAMLALFRGQLALDVGWKFTITCCRRVWNDLLPVFRKVVENMERGLGWDAVDEELDYARRKLRSMTKRYQRMSEGPEFERLGKQIGAADLIFAFEFQDPIEAASYASKWLIERATDAVTEKQQQVDLLRRLRQEFENPVPPL